MAHQNECHFAHEITNANALPNEIPDETVALPLLMSRFLSAYANWYAFRWKARSLNRMQARISVRGGAA